jgi:hypothetical protein
VRDDVLPSCAEIWQSHHTPRDAAFAMNSNDAPPSPEGYPSASNAYYHTTGHADNAFPAWRKYIFLYSPLITNIFLLIFTPAIGQALGLQNGGQTFAFVAFSAIPTYLIGSLFYPTNRPDPTPDESIRFTRKNDLYRAAVIATYGRLYGTSFNIMFVITDVMFSFVPDNFIGERPVGTEKRRSEFLVALLWVIGSQVVQVLIPISTPVIGLLIGMADRTLWRTAYVALVDDVAGVLTRPNIRTLRGKATLVLVQACVILSISYMVLSWIKRVDDAKKAEMNSLFALTGTSPARPQFRM